MHLLDHLPSSNNSSNMGQEVTRGTTARDLRTPSSRVTVRLPRSNSRLTGRLHLLRTVSSRLMDNNLHMATLRSNSQHTVKRRLNLAMVNLPHLMVNPRRLLRPTASLLPLTAPLNKATLLPAHPPRQPHTPNLWGTNLLLPCNPTLPPPISSASPSPPLLPLHP